MGQVIMIENTEATKKLLTPPEGSEPKADGSIGANLKNLSERYKLLNELGVGGMGTVFRAVERETKATYAVKVMHRHLKADAANVLRFEREAQLAMSLQHPNIVEVFDFGLTEASEPYMVMEYLEGENLDDMLEESGRLSIEKFAPIFSQVCAGLSYAHESNIVHRDIKPSNIMLVAGTTPPQVKIVDFGIAKACASTGEICPTSVAILQSMDWAADKPTEEVAALLQTLTQPGEIFGSPLYMSPEQCNGQEADCRSEVYSLGCMVFEILTGAAPLRGRDAMETMLKKVRDKPPLMGSIAKDTKFSDELEAVVQHCLERDPDKRYQSVAELGQAWKQFESSKN
jgi:serine/threonine protein kinase